MADASYEEKVRIYDDNCLGCPFNLLQVIKGNKIISEHHNIQDAIEISLDFFDSRITRNCIFGDNFYTLTEIVTNTCRLWNRTEKDEGKFIEIGSLTELNLELDIRL